MGVGRMFHQTHFILDEENEKREENVQRVRLGSLPEVGNAENFLGIVLSSLRQIQQFDENAILIWNRRRLDNSESKSGRGRRKEREKRQKTEENSSTEMFVDGMSLMSIEEWVHLLDNPDRWDWDICPLLDDLTGWHCEKRWRLDHPRRAGRPIDSLLVFHLSFSRFSSNLVKWRRSCNGINRRHSVKQNRSKFLTNDCKKNESVLVVFWTRETSWSLSVWEVEKNRCGTLCKEHYRSSRQSEVRKSKWSDRQFHSDGNDESHQTPMKVSRKGNQSSHVGRRSSPSPCDICIDDIPNHLCSCRSSGKEMLNVSIVDPNHPISNAHHRCVDQAGSTPGDLIFLITSFDYTTSMCIVSSMHIREIC